MNKALLISLALLLAISAGVVGCVGVIEYDLTMAVAPPGSGTATDLTGTSPYAANTSVNIQAVAVADYQFASWSAPAGTFANPNAATTTFTMPAQNVTVTAHFVRPLDHFKSYEAQDVMGPIPIGEVVYLEDQFGAFNATVGDAEVFCNPVEKLHDGVTTPISHPDHHLTLYLIDYEEAPQTWQVEVDNQFGTQNLTVYGPIGLAVPTQKDPLPQPVGLDHFLIYIVIDGLSVEAVVDLDDQFGDDPEVLVYEPYLFANPVRKTHDSVVTEIENPDEHLVFYTIDGGVFEGQVQIDNQFGEQSLNVYNPYHLAVPSVKLSAEPIP